MARTMEQAIQMASLHAIDGLISLNIPIFRDKVKQAQFMAKRNALHMPNFEQMQKLRGIEQVFCNGMYHTSLVQMMYNNEEEDGKDELLDESEEEH